MKRALIGGFLSLLGTIWGLAIIVAANMNLVDGWGEYGRLLTTVFEMDLTLPLILSAVFTAAGVIIMLVEFFRKDS